MNIKLILYIRKLLVVFILNIILINFFVCLPVYSQDTKPEQKVSDVVVKGNNAVSTDTILLNIKTAKGRDLIQKQLNEDIKRLYATGYFSDVEVELENYLDGVRVIFIVTEKATIEKIVFKGNDSIGDKRLLKEIETKEKNVLSRRVLSADVKKIKAYYRKKGFPLIDVGFSIDEGKDNKVIVTITVDEKTKYVVKKIEFSGNNAFNGKVLQKQMATKKSWWFISGVLDTNTLEEDMQRIKQFYESKGYIDAAVDNELTYNAQDKGIYILINIDEGLQYTVGKVSVSGNIAFNNLEIEDELVLKQGKPYNPAELRADVIRMQTLYFDEGYMNCQIAPDTILRRENQSIDLSYNITEGEVNYINKIRITGNSKTKDVVIRRELRLYPGDKYAGEKLRRSKERLYNLGFFEEIVFDTKPTDKTNRKDLEVAVKESKTGEFSFGGGYSSVERLVGFIQVTQKNFDIMNFPTFTGAGQQLALRATLGSVQRNYELSFTEPWIFGYPYLFGFDLYNTQTLRKSALGYGYDEEHTGGALRFGKEFTDYDRADLIYRLEEVRISDVPLDASSALKDEEGKNTTSSIGLTLTRDTRNNKFNPMSGYLISGTALNGGGPIGGDKDFYKLSSGASLYLNHKEKLVLELKGRLGWVEEYDDTTSVPIYERFFAGGANTIRGYKERSIGPRDPNTSDPIGGGSMVLGSAELTYPVFKNVKIAAFSDMGNVWEQSNDLGSGDYKYSIGTGVRLNTPIGPVKVDFGYPLEEAHPGDKKKGRFHFSMTRGF